MHAPAGWADAEDKTAGLLLVGKKKIARITKIRFGCKYIGFAKGHNSTKSREVSTQHSKSIKHCIDYF